MSRILTGVRNYHSIPHLSTSNLGVGDRYIDICQELLLTERRRDRQDQIIVTEKYDGSNLGILKMNGLIHPIVRRGYHTDSSPFEQHHRFTRWVSDREDIFHNILGEGDRLVVEWMVQVHGTHYQISGEPAIFLDYISASQQRMLYTPFFEILERYGLRAPRVLHWGDSVAPDKLVDTLNERTTGMWSIEPPEGMVYRLERLGKFKFTGKWVHADYVPGKYMELDRWNEFNEL